MNRLRKFGIKNRELFMAALAAMTGVAHAVGGMDGGGGKGVVCRDAVGHVLKAELLDLYEARLVGGLTIPESSDSVEAQVVTVAGKLVGVAGQKEAVAGHALNIKNRLARMLPEGTALNPTDDSFEVIVPTGCKIEQVAIYQPDSVVLVNGDIYAALSETNKAALWVHEAVYHFERQSGWTSDSRSTRRVVGELFSDRVVFEPKFKDVKAGDVFCIGEHPSGGVSVLFGYKNPTPHEGWGDKYRLEFGILAGKSFYSKTYIDVPSFIPDIPAPGGSHVSGRLSSNFESGSHRVDIRYSAEGSSPIVTLSGKRSFYDGDEIESTKLHCREATEAVILMPW